MAFSLNDGPRIDARCHDVCLGGAFIETADVAPFGSEIAVYLRLPGLDEESVVKATVRWVKPEGMGVQFASLGIHETLAIMELVKSGR
jgi:Tfp pilus assembly protein PilZ